MCRTGRQCYDLFLELANVSDASVIWLIDMSSSPEAGLQCKRANLLRMGEATASHVVHPAVDAFRFPIWSVSSASFQRHGRGVGSLARHERGAWHALLQCVHGLCSSHLFFFSRHISHARAARRRFSAEPWDSPGFSIVRGTNRHRGTRMTRKSRGGNDGRQARNVYNPRGEGATITPPFDPRSFCHLSNHV